MAVHPRIRGERTVTPNASSSVAGSSPHTRGTRKTAIWASVWAGFIPAYAGNALRRPPSIRQGSVHPRIRGERRGMRNRMAHGYGSSPHTRGTQSGSLSRLPYLRFIPAYAGNASAREISNSEIRVHPRIRGERTHDDLVMALVIGSSPHTRGTQSGSLCRLPYLRFIPAYAGNASAREISNSEIRVHPRIRGERTHDDLVMALVIGSSPHTRGTQSGSLCRLPYLRFIPAYAGNAVACETAWHTATVHPRIRGERLLTVRPSAKIAGSSPHTRGTQWDVALLEARHRFIPAYAGNAYFRQPFSVPVAVHPRIRGERIHAERFDLFKRGSSPHTRGTQMLPVNFAVNWRFIPAYAGNAYNGIPSRPLYPVHPRIRGERFCRTANVSRQSGSSPHTRGTHQARRRARRDHRFIPAYAGNA